MKLVLFLISQFLIFVSSNSQYADTTHVLKEKVGSKLYSEPRHRSDPTDDCGCYGHYCPPDQECSCERPLCCSDSMTDDITGKEVCRSDHASDCTPRPQCRPRTPCCVGENCIDGCRADETCVYQQVLCKKEPCCLVPNCISGRTRPCNIFCIATKVCKPYQSAGCFDSSCVVPRCVGFDSCPTEP